MEVHVNKKLCFMLIALAVAPVALYSQEPPAASSNPITASEKGFYTLVSGEVVAAAEKMPEQNYSLSQPRRCAVLANWSATWPTLSTVFARRLPANRIP